MTTESRDSCWAVTVFNLFNKIFNCKGYIMSNGVVRFKLKQLFVINDTPNNCASNINFTLIETNICFDNVSRPQ
jgi:hypothetical protein